VTLLGGAAARAAGYREVGDEQDIARVRELLEGEARACVGRFADRLARLPAFRRLVRAVAVPLLERGELDGAEAEALLESAWASMFDAREGGTVEEDAAIQRELDVRRIVGIVNGTADPPGDIDEEARLLRLYEELRAWRRDWWHLGPLTPAAASSDLPDELEVEVVDGDEPQRFVLSRDRIDRAIEDGYTLRTALAENGTETHSLVRSRSATRAYDGYGSRLIGEEVR
jgi:hypothetical protein